MTNHSDWMGELYDTIKDTPLCKLPIPGSHDSGSYGSYSTDRTAKTQSLTVKQQLEYGIRFFDLRIRARGKIFFIHHGPTPTNNELWVNNDGILADVRDFVTAHKKELVILHCWDMDNSIAGGSGFTSDDERDKEFVRLMQTVFGNKLIPSTTSNPNDTVAALLARGNVIVITDFHVDNDADKVWHQRPSIIDFYDPPTISVPLGSLETGGTNEGITLAKIQSLLNGLETAFNKTRTSTQFYKTQAVFAYDAILIAGYASMMEYGAQRLNPIAITQFRDWILTSRSPMNIIIADFVEYGGMVETIVSTIQNNWPVRSPSPQGRRATPLKWSGAGEGWLLSNRDRHVIAGNRFEPDKYLVGLWVRGQGTYGVVDFAPVYTDQLNGKRPSAGSTAPPPADWQLGHWNAGNTDVKLLAAPAGAHITRIDVAEQSTHGVVNVRVLTSNSPHPSGPAWSDASQNWTEGPSTGAPIMAMESAFQGGYGVVNFRYAIGPSVMSTM